MNASELMFKALERISRDWDGDHADMQEASEAMSAYRAALSRQSVGLPQRSISDDIGFTEVLGEFLQDVGAKPFAMKLTKYIDEWCAMNVPAPQSVAVGVDAKPHSYIVRANDGHETWMKTDPVSFRSNGYPELGFKVVTLYDHPAPAAQAAPSDFLKGRIKALMEENAKLRAATQSPAVQDGPIGYVSQSALVHLSEYTKHDMPNSIRMYNKMEIGRVEVPVYTAQPDHAAVRDAWLPEKMPEHIEDAIMAVLYEGGLTRGMGPYRIYKAIHAALQSAPAKKEG